MSSQVDDRIARTQQAQLVSITPGGGTVHLTTEAGRPGGVVCVFSVTCIDDQFQRK